MNESRLKQFAIVFTKLYYCSSVWANTSKRNVTKLQSIQNLQRVLSLVHESMTACALYAAL